MPHKNRWCPKCRTGKMKFVKWLEDTGRVQPFSTAHVWKYEVKCPECGEVGVDWRARRGWGGKEWYE